MFTAMSRHWRPFFFVLAGLAACAPARAQVLFGPNVPYGPGGTVFPMAGYNQRYQGAAFPLNNLDGGGALGNYGPRPMVNGRYFDRGLTEVGPVGGDGLPLSYTQPRLDQLVDQPDTVRRNRDTRVLELRNKKDRLYAQVRGERDPKAKAELIKEYQDADREFQRELGSTGRRGTVTALRGGGGGAGAAARKDPYGSPGWFARHPIPLTRVAPGYPAPKDPPPAESVPTTATARAVAPPAAAAPAPRRAAPVAPAARPAPAR